jgi:phosphate:Na+ symporter
MNADFDFWRMLAGLGLFLFAMAQLEAALKAIGGRSLAAFLRRQTNTPLKAVGGGIVATALLQSSSVVGLMVLAFTAAGLLNLASALGVVFGANLGTTFTGWIVATLGFKVDLEELVLPLIGAGGLLFVFGRDGMARFGQAVVGLALLLLGLQFMKESVALLSESLDVGALAELAVWQYLLFGTIFAAIVQSSSATMMVTLAALDAGVITLPNAAAIAIGADLGTTSTVLLGAVKGSSSKRRVAVAHLLFNCFTALLALALRAPLLQLVAAIGISDQLYALVAFHSVFNLLGLSIFVPAIKPFATWLEQRFHTQMPDESHYITEVEPSVVEAAMQAMDRETAHLIARVVRQNMLVFSPPLPRPPGRLPVAVGKDEDLETTRFNAMYDGTKQLEGEILAFAARLQSEPLTEDQSRRLSQLLSSVREAVHSTKQLKDIRHNLQSFEEAGGTRLADYLEHFRSVMSSFNVELYALRRSDASAPRPEDVIELTQQVHDRHDQLHGDIYSDVRARRVPESDTSSLLNVNRELLNSNLSLISALADYHLSPDKALDFKRLPRAS